MSAEIKYKHENKMQLIISKPIHVSKRNKDKNNKQKNKTQTIKRNVYCIKV